MAFSATAGANLLGDLMLRRLLNAAVAVLIAVLPVQYANAMTGTLDDVPAATLLYPYFEVDLDNANGRNTVIGLHNTSATAMLTKVTMWSNAGVPVYAFNVYLTGYDAISFDMRSIFGGTLPVTASAGQDPTDTISHKGPISQDINFASCSGTLPPANPIAASYLSDLRAMFTGRASTTQFANQCVGTNAGDNVARGYVTIDAVNQCSAATVSPATPGYFVSGGAGQATNQNTLLGDYMLVDQSQNRLEVLNAVSIEASNYYAPDARLTTAGNYTFYGRLVGWTAADNREPLATRWGLQGDTGTSQAIVWRDSKTVPAAFSCSPGLPAYAPLGQEGISFFDRASKPTIIPAPPTQTNPFPPGITVGAVATQLTNLNSATLQFPTNTKLGYLTFNLNTTLAGNSNPPVDPAAAQSHVSVIRNLKGVNRLATGAVSTALDNALSTVYHYNEINN